MSGTGANLPVRIQVEGGAQAEAAFNRVAATGERAMRQVADGTAQASNAGGNLRNVIGQAGYQVQDFAVQVQGGTSALTALSQQGGQFLGIFGPAGAAAGAVLTIGLIAAQFLTASENAAEAEKRADTAFRNMRTGAQDLANVLREVNALFQTQGERAAASANETREAMAVRLREQLSMSLMMQEDASTRLGEAQAELARLQGGMGTAAQGRILMQRAAEERARALGQPAPEAPQIEVPERELYDLRARIRNFEVDIGRSGAAMTRAQEALNRLEAVGTRDAPTGADRDAAEALRRSLDDRYRINQEYEEKVADLRRRAAQGLLPEGEIGSLELQAARRRDEALQRLNRTPGSGGRAARPDRPGLDVEGVLAAGVRESTEAFNDFNEALNLSEAGLSGAQGALNRYERDMTMLETALARGAITEEQFTAAVEAGTLALGRQIEEVQRRGQNTDALGRELGMTFSSAFEDAIVKGSEFSDVLKGIEQDLARLVIRQAITAPLASAISGAVKGFDFSSIFTSMFAARADGGPVSMGTTYLVGERGPELFTPGASGNITPNHAMGGTGGITYSPTINVDARGSDANTLARARMEAQAISQATIAQFADSIQRGGGAARLVGRR